MGVPLPPLQEPSQQQSERTGGTTHSARPAGGAQRRFSPDGFDELSAAANARLSSLSSLLAFTRSVGAGSQPLPPTRPPAAASVPRLPPPAFPRWSPSSPPPLAEESDGGSDWGGDVLPPLLPDSPPGSQQPRSLDDICPWGLIDEDDEDDEDVLMQEMPLLRPRRDILRQPNVLRALPRMYGGGGGGARGAPGTSAGDSFLSLALQRQSLRVLPTGVGSMHAAPAQAAAAGSPQPLEAELAGMAGRLAELVRQHQGSAHPGVLSNLQDAANLLQGLANGAGLPPPA